MLVNEQNLTTLYTIAVSEFRDAERAALATFDHQVFTREVPVVGKHLNLSWLGNVKKWREWVGPRIVDSLEAYGYTLTPKRWENTIGLQREDIDDAADNPAVAADEFGLPAAMEDMGRMGAYWRMEQAAQAMIDNGTCFDGNAFFSVSHPNGSAGATAFDNIDTSGNTTNPWYLLDTRFVKPIIGGMRKMPEVEMDRGNRFFDTGELRVGGYARAVWGYSLPEFFFSSTKTLNVTNIRAHMDTMKAYTNDKAAIISPRANILMVGRESEWTAKDIVEIMDLGADNPGRRLGLTVVYNPFLP